MLFRRLSVLGIEDEAFSALVLEKTKQAIAQNFPEKIASGCVPHKYSKGRIIVFCVSPNIHYFMQQYQKTLLTLLQKEFSKEPIKSLSFTLAR